MYNKKKSFIENREGAIGIGAMIIFIALILVAAVASTIIIKTAEELQQRAEQTGDDTRDELSGKIQVIGAYISDDNAAGTAADEITLITQLSAGSDSTLLSDISWFIVCEDTAAGTSDVNSDDFDGLATDLSGTLIVAGSTVESGETFLVPIDTSTTCSPTVGDDQEMRILINGGGETYVQLHYNSVDNGATIV